MATLSRSPDRPRKDLIAEATTLRELAESGDLGDAEVMFNADGSIAACTFAALVRGACRAIADHPDWSWWTLEERLDSVKELRRLVTIYRRGGAEALAKEMQG